MVAYRGLHFLAGDNSLVVVMVAQSLRTCLIKALNCLMVVLAIVRCSPGDWLVLFHGVPPLRMKRHSSSSHVHPGLLWVAGVPRSVLKKAHACW